MLTGEEKDTGWRASAGVPEWSGRPWSGAGAEVTNDTDTRSILARSVTTVTNVMNHLLSVLRPVNPLIQSL